jgi:hypothetical protein
LADGGLAAASPYDVKVARRDGRSRAGLDLPGIERLVGAADRLAYVRVRKVHERPVVGLIRVLPGGMELVTEVTMPESDDPFPDLSVSPDGARLVAGNGPDAVVDYLLTERGWSEPTRHDLRRSR